MKVLLVIPARFASVRYPGKPLVMLKGATGQKKPLIERSWEAAQAVPGIARVVVATDDQRIAAAAQGFGAEVVMTPSSCANGTERCAAAHDALGAGYDIVVNLQGDAPLTPPWFVTALIDELAKDTEAGMATPVLACDGAMLAGLLADRSAGRVGGTTAVFGAGKRALYFSREVIPHLARPFAPDEPTPVFHHVGVYAYRAAVLAQYHGWPVGPLERSEGLEQLRFLEQGCAVCCVEVDAHGHPFWELNNPEDLPKIESLLAETGKK